MKMSKILNKELDNCNEIDLRECDGKDIKGTNKKLLV